ncbi:hypothetical protein HDU76_011663, partial [Blyttiomyces sp. JEL0837]
MHDASGHDPGPPTNKRTHPELDHLPLDPPHQPQKTGGTPPTTPAPLTPLRHTIDTKQELALLNVISTTMSADLAHSLALIAPGAITPAILDCIIKHHGSLLPCPQCNLAINHGWDWNFSDKSYHCMALTTRDPNLSPSAPSTPCPGRLSPHNIWTAASTFPGQPAPAEIPNLNNHLIALFLNQPSTFPPGPPPPKFNLTPPGLSLHTLQSRLHSANANAAHYFTDPNVDIPQNLKSLIHTLLNLTTDALKFATDLQTKARHEVKTFATAISSAPAQFTAAQRLTKPIAPSTPVSSLNLLPASARPAAALALLQGKDPTTNRPLVSTPAVLRLPADITANNIQNPDLKTKVQNGQYVYVQGIPR